MLLWPWPCNQFICSLQKKPPQKPYYKKVHSDLWAFQGPQEDRWSSVCSILTGYREGRRLCAWWSLWLWSRSRKFLHHTKTGWGEECIIKGGAHVMQTRVFEFWSCKIWSFVTLRSQKSLFSDPIWFIAIYSHLVTMSATSVAIATMQACMWLTS